MKQTSNTYSSKSTPGRLASRLLLVSRDLLEALAARPVLAVAVLGTFTAVVAAGIGLLTGIPLPSFHDEFSYLLQADTFASGRLTNPTPPMWEHFETFHVILQPTYASKYPPGQGLMLALGQVIGHPILAVWLSSGLMVAAITWMLYAWLPPRWAVVTGLVVAIQVGVASYWAQSYWGGAVAATGGAILYGALRRALDTPSTRLGLLLGLGLSILILSRPFEGILVSLPAAAVLTHQMVVRERRRCRTLLRVAVPTILLLATTVVFIGYYNWRVTGDPGRLPYTVHEEQYATAPTFLWQDRPAQPQYRHSSIEKFWRTHVAEGFQAYQGPWAFVRLSMSKTLKNLLFFLGPGIVLLIYVPSAARDRWILFAVLSSSGILLAGLATAWSYPHYMAPAAGLLYAALGACLMKVYRAGSDSRSGPRRLALVMFAFLLSPFVGFDRYVASEAFTERRSEVCELLMQRSGTDLVIVHYGPGHNPHDEWVYNRADISDAAIVWARDIGPSENREIVRHFADRRAWKLYVASDSIRLRETTWTQGEQDNVFVR